MGEKMGQDLFDNEHQRNLDEMRDYKVVKANDLIQKTRFNLTLQEQKIILFLISKIKPEDLELKTHDFKILEFCQVCGIETDSGGNYKYIKNTIKSLSDKSFWIEIDQKEKLLRWIYTAEISKRSGLISIRLSDEIKAFLIQLQEKFTQYELIYTLSMKSQYSIRLYELLKSYEYRHGHIFSIEELKKKLNAETYNRFQDLRRYSLEPALKEINELTDLTVTYAVEKVGRKFEKIKFDVELKKDSFERFRVFKQIEANLGGKNKPKQTKTSLRVSKKN
jgi:plasmid replication initiation protein